MSLDQTTENELRQLAHTMQSQSQNVSKYGNLGTLVKKDSPEFSRYEDEIALGEVMIDGNIFIYFAN